MFLASIVTPTLLGPSLIIPTVNGNLPHSNGIRLAYQDIIFAPFATPTPTLQLYQVGYPHPMIPPMKINTSKDPTRKNAKSSKSRKGKTGFSVRSNHTPRERNILKDYGHSSHYTSKGSRSSSDSTKKGFYTSLVKKLLFRPHSRSRKKEYSSNMGDKLSSPVQPMQMLASALSAPGWGWGKGGGGHGGGGGGISLLDLLLLKLSLLSLLGFLLNLLLNLANLFGFGFMTSTATYPVTSTSTATATATGGGTAAALTYPTVIDNGWASSGLGSGLGITGRTIDSLGGKGWGWGHGGDRARIKFHVKLPHHGIYPFVLTGWGWSNTTTATTTTTTTTELPLLPAIIPTLTGNLGVTDLGYLSSYAGARRRTRSKRETFKPYVDPITSLEVFAKAVLNSIESARNKYECIEKIHCENNKHARVVGQWLDYFMPLYSFSLSFFGHRMGAHHSLFDHLRAIVLGATETNCRAHFPRCEPSDRGAVK